MKNVLIVIVALIPLLGCQSTIDQDSSNVSSTYILWITSTETGHEIQFDGSYTSDEKNAAPVSVEKETPVRISLSTKKVFALFHNKSKEAKLSVKVLRIDEKNHEQFVMSADGSRGVVVRLDESTKKEYHDWGIKAF